MTPYLSILTVRFREVLQYRAAAWAGVFTQVVFGFILLMSLLAFYASSAEEPPLSRPQLLAYIWLGQALLGLFPWNADRDIQALIRTGAVAYELARPLDTYWVWYARTMGWRLASTLLRALPLVALVAGVFPLVGMGAWAMPGPASWASFGWFVAGLSVAVALGVAMTTLLHVVILWTLNVDGTIRLFLPLVTLFSGMIIPLPLFPESLQPLLWALPFRGLIDVPFRLYNGDIPPDAALGPVLLSAAWAALLIVLGRAVMARGFRRVVIQGG